jgi:hypothetical protein
LFTGLEDWRSDGYRWRQNGTTLIPKKSPMMKKIHFDLMTDTGTVKTFRKFVYLILDCADKWAVVHYIGDERVATDFPHGMLSFDLYVEYHFDRQINVVRHL